MRQYSAKLLFQWRPVRRGVSRKRRLCDERIVTFPARSPRGALSNARRLGASGEFTDSRDGVAIHFEFVGILQLLDVTGNYRDGEVWWELRERVRPSERRSSIVPPERQLDALRKSAPKRRHQLKAW